MHAITVSHSIRGGWTALEIVDFLYLYASCVERIYHRKTVVVHYWGQ